MKIGRIKTENNIFAAPLAGVTNKIYRKILKDMGAGLLYTEMISAKALCYGDKKTIQLMNLKDEKKPIAVQIFASDPDVAAEGARIAVNAVAPDIIDINMGCPVPKVVSNGEGSALLQNPHLAGEMVRMVKLAVNVPVTAKIRSGWDENSVNAVETAKILEANGLDAIAVHGRTRMQYYSGTADRNIIREVKRAVKIPVIGNGDIFSPQSAKDMFEFTGCDAVMLGRGIMGNPWLMRECVAYMNGEPVPEHTLSDVIDMALYHTSRLVESRGENHGIKEARSHLTWYVKGYRGAAKIKNLLTSATSLEEIKEIFAEWREKEGI